jgi:serine phosphatase RsbU (regulator of sigma subunit)
MASLLAVQGPNQGQRFPLEGESTTIGRQPDVGIFLEALAVSRQHARVLHQNGDYYLEDLGSSNGTYVNGRRIKGRVALSIRDTVHIGPYVFTLQIDPPASPTETQTIVRARVDAAPTNQTLYAQNPSYKLQVVLEIARDLGRTLDQDALLRRLLDQLFRLFPQADRGMVLLCDGDRYRVRAQRTRLKGGEAEFQFSKSVVKKALDEGVGLLSEDVGADSGLVMTRTLVSLNLRSFLCVPLIGGEKRRLGVIQLDCLRSDQSFGAADLELLTAVALHVAVVLENATLHAERLREARLLQELAMARDIQQSFLPAEFGALREQGVELFARVHAAREVSGDLYDFFPLPDGRLAFFLGDVSGKGMPAALFMIAVRTLIRHLAPTAGGPADLLRRLHAALVADNPTNLYVTVAHGVYDSRDGALLLSSGGHPPPLRRDALGTVTPVAMRASHMVGSPMLDPVLADTRLTLLPEETLVLYTDGFTEARAPDGETLFGVERLCELLGGPRTSLPLDECAAEASAGVRRFTGQDELQDDQTLLLLRRK